jgi:Flp pilus assembly protein TadB
MYLGLLAFIGATVLVSAVEGLLSTLGVAAWVVIYALGGIVYFLNLAALRRSAQRVADTKDEKLDERQRSIRDRAYRGAYTIFSSITVLVFIYLALCHFFRGAQPVVAVAAKRLWHRRRLHPTEHQPAHGDRRLERADLESEQ